MTPIPPAERIAILNDYQAWVRQVRDLLREAVFADDPETRIDETFALIKSQKHYTPAAAKVLRSLEEKPVFRARMYLRRFIELFFAQMDLESRLGLMNDIVRDLISVYEERVRGERRAEAEQELNGLGHVDEPMGKAELTRSERQTKPTDGHARPLGRPRKHPDAKCRKALKQFSDLYAESNDATGAWNKVADNLDFGSGEAARKACERYQQAQRAQNTGQNGQK